MKKLLLFVMLLVASICCKTRGDKNLEIIPENENYLLIDSQRCPLDSMSVTYQKSLEGYNYQIMAINRSKEIFVAIQYLVLDAPEDVPAGEFIYHNSVDLKNLLRDHFHNISVRCEAPNGEKLTLDGLAGADVQGGTMKIVQDGENYYMVAASTIGGRKVMFRYDGKIKIEEFDW